MAIAGENHGWLACGINPRLEPDRSWTLKGSSILTSHYKKKNLRMLYNVRLVRPRL